MSETNFFTDNFFFQQNNFFLRLSFVPDWIFLGLYTAVVFRMQSFNFQCILMGFASVWMKDSCQSLLPLKNFHTGDRKTKKKQNKNKEKKTERPMAQLSAG